MPYYRICAECGDRLDPGEPCEQCRKNAGKKRYRVWFRKGCDADRARIILAKSEDEARAQVLDCELDGVVIGNVEVLA